MNVTRSVVRRNVIVDEDNGIAAINESRTKRPRAKGQKENVQKKKKPRVVDDQAQVDGPSGGSDEDDRSDQHLSNLSGCDAESGEGEEVRSQGSCARTFVDGGARNRERDCAPLAATLYDLGEAIEAEETDKLANGQVKTVPIEPWEPGTGDGLSAKLTRHIERDEDKEIVKNQMEKTRRGKGSNWDLIDNEDNV